jgi:hypothetical protein
MPQDGRSADQLDSSLAVESGSDVEGCVHVGHPLLAVRNTPAGTVDCGLDVEGQPRVAEILEPGVEIERLAVSDDAQRAADAVRFRSGAMAFSSR